ncbi:hypothetical protein F8B43_4570 [Methylorubrum populi]|uniref:Uncharacterized protein n=1 Tax=Methylorubrum populi TaxID=223967 RepID=A0A833J481_9HYPH|nr:hypothetical protein F8B43_4570 [Methylorubrum populi]
MRDGGGRCVSLGLVPVRMPVVGSSALAGPTGAKTLRRGG